jgi:GNAT superfamily N-acetyltransferase
MTLIREKNPAFEFCEAKYFMAYKDGVLAGRIAGIINHKANKIWNQSSARFSFVDFIDDNEVSTALFKAVENWGKAKGMNMIKGPLGFTDLDHEGLLVFGFKEVATMATAYSYPYYVDHIEKLGFKKEQDWHEFKIKIPKETPERFQRVADIVSKKYGLKVKKFRKTKEIWPYATKLFELWNEAYKPLYEYSELSPKQIEYYIKMYIPMLRMDLVTLVVREEDDAIVGLAIALPNLSKALQKAEGKLLPVGWVHLLKGMYGKGNKVVDLYTIGVAPEYQNKGVNAMIVNDIVLACNKHGYVYAESNPELELNTKVQSQWELFETEHHKTRRAFVKKL